MKTVLSLRSSSLRKVEMTLSMMGANHEKGKGTISLLGLLNITNVLYVEGLRVNLLSISQICDQDFKVLFSKGKMPCVE